MSRWVTTRTPILDTECLVMAFDALRCQYTKNGESFAVHVGSYNPIQYNYTNGHYQVSYYKDHRDERNFVDDVEKNYKRFYQEKLDRIEQEKQEQIRLEEERKLKEQLERFKENQKNEIIKKSKSTGL